MAKTQATLLDLESMMDDSLDHIQEAPDFIQPPAGDYDLVTKGGKITKFENDDGRENWFPVMNLLFQMVVFSLSVSKELKTVWGCSSGKSRRSQELKTSTELLLEPSSKCWKASWNSAAGFPIPPTKVGMGRSVPV